MSYLISLIEKNESYKAFNILLVKHRNKIESVLNEAQELAQLANQKNPELGLKWYETLLEYLPNRIVCHMGYGNALIATNCLKQAEEFFKETINKFPKAPKPWLRYAWIAEQKEEYQEAYKRYQEASKLFPNNSKIQSNFRKLDKKVNSNKENHNISTPSWKIEEIQNSFCRQGDLICSVAQLHEKTILIATQKQNLYISRDGGNNFQLLCNLSDNKSSSVGRLHSDGNAIYYSNFNKLYKYTDDTKNFEVVVHNFRSKTRGFAKSENGYLFMGKYSEYGPAILLGSPDGVNWKVVRKWDAKHIHDVRINPINGWLYVVVGEADKGKSKSRDSHSIFRSKDNGSSFYKIFTVKQIRPLFTVINFYKNRVLLGTDHYESRNKIMYFEDTGENKIYDIKTLFIFPSLYPYLKPCPYVYYMEWFNGSLFVGFRGQQFCALVESRNLVNWKLIYCTTTNRYQRFGRACVGKNYLFLSAGNLIRVTCKSKQSKNRNHTGIVLSNSEIDANYDLNIDLDDGWSLSIENQIKKVLFDVDPRFKEEFCRGFFYYSNPFSIKNIYWREALIFLLHENFNKDSRILDFGTGTGQFLLFLAKFGFDNLYGWDYNQRWLTAAEELFLQLDHPDRIALRCIPKNAIYNIANESNMKFDVITMFGLIYGHGINIEKALISVNSALTPGGLFIANNAKHTKNNMKEWISKAGLSLVSTITKTNSKGNEISKIYFCKK